MEEKIKTLKLDITKLKTVANYAKDKLLSPARIYQLGKEGKVNIIKIDGIQFVKLS